MHWPFFGGDYKEMPAFNNNRTLSHLSRSNANQEQAVMSYLVYGAKGLYILV